MTVEVEIVRIPIDPESLPALAQVLHEARRDGYLRAPACRSMYLSASPDNRILTVTIRWANAALHAAARERPEAAQFFKRFAELASGPPTLDTSLELEGPGALDGQVALVTGAASGIGRAVVERFIAEGAHVAALDRDERKLRSLTEDFGDSVTIIAGDVSTAEGNERAVSATIKKFGKIDVLVLNAGLFDGFADFSKLSVQQVGAAYDEIFNVNVRGMMLGVAAALPHLAVARGSIIFTLSNASFDPDGGGAFYVASKHAGLGLMRQLAHEFAPHVRVNAVAPGATKTPIGVPPVFGIQLDQQSEAISAAISDVVPLRLHAMPADHAAAYVLLASRSESKAMTGTVIASDGGLAVRGIRRVRGGDDLPTQPRIS